MNPSCFCEIALNVAKKVVPAKDQKREKPWISNETLKLIEHKHRIYRVNDTEGFRIASRQVKLATKKDRESGLVKSHHR